MNKWKKSTEVKYSTNNTATVLIDYVDQSADTATRPNATCPSTPAITWSPITPANDITGFYACVDKDNTTAQVFIRGNALARIENDANRIKYSADNKTNFPSTSVRVQGRGLLFR